MDNIPEQSSNSLLPVVKATSTLQSAICDPFNLLMTIPPVILILQGIYSIIRYGFSIIWLFIIIVMSFFVWRYVRAILNRTITINNEGIHYQEAARKLFFTWQQIEAVRIQSSQKQLTIWTLGKPYRIHEFGLPQDELDSVRKAFNQYISAHHIKLR